MFFFSVSRYRSHIINLRSKKSKRNNSAALESIKNSTIYLPYWRTKHSYTIISEVRLFPFLQHIDYFKVVNCPYFWLYINSIHIRYKNQFKCSNFYNAHACLRIRNISVLFQLNITNWTQKYSSLTLYIRTFSMYIESNFHFPF